MWNMTFRDNGRQDKDEGATSRPEVARALADQPMSW